MPRGPLAAEGWRRGVSVAAWIALTAAASAQSTQRASVAPDGSELPADSEIGRYGAHSDDGRFIVFVTAHDGLVAGDGNGKRDVYLRDQVTGTTQLVSHTTAGLAGDDESYEPAMTPDGAFVAFTSRASNLAKHDNSPLDVFVWESATDTVTRISNGLGGASGNGASDCPSLSRDGHQVAFRSYAKNLVAVDLNNEVDAFVFDRATSTMRLASLDDQGNQPSGYTYLDFTAISKDGSTLAFVTDARLVAADSVRTLHVYAVDLASGLPELINLTTTGAPAGSTFLQPIYLSADGRFVAFESTAQHLVDPDTNGATLDIFLRDRVVQSTEVVSLDNDGLQPSSGPSCAGPISDDGRIVAFFGATGSYLPDETAVFGVLLRDRTLGMTLLASRSDSGEPGDGGQYNFASSLSADGRRIAFSSLDPLVAADGNGKRDVDVRERAVDAASWSGYGQGLAGRHGIPALALDAAPQLQSDVTLSIDNSSGLWAVGIVLWGVASSDLPLFGGDLLVAPLASMTIILPPGGLDLSVEIPPDERLVGLPLYVQALQIDPWAIEGVALTPGITAIPGY